MRSHLDLFSQVLYLVQNNYVEAPDNEKLIKGAIDGMLKTLDPHTVLPARGSAPSAWTRSSRASTRASASSSSCATARSW